MHTLWILVNLIVDHFDTKRSIHHSAKSAHWKSPTLCCHSFWNNNAIEKKYIDSECSENFVKWQVSKIFRKEDDIMSLLISNNSVWRTAPATPSLYTIVSVYFEHPKNMRSFQFCKFSVFTIFLTPYKDEKSSVLSSLIWIINSFVTSKVLERSVDICNEKEIFILIFV